MLILTRRCDEAIMIGDRIQVKVLRVGQDVVRIGIEAPSDVAIHRREIYEQIRRENQAAAQTASAVETVADRLRQWTGTRSGDEPR